MVLRETGPSTTVMVGGTIDTVTLALNYQPQNGDVVIDVSSADQAFAATPDRLIFTAEDWSQPRQVRLEGLASGETALVFSIDDQRSDAEFHPVENLRFEFEVLAPVPFVSQETLALRLRISTTQRVG